MKRKIREGKQVLRMSGKVTGFRNRYSAGAIDSICQITIALRSASITEQRHFARGFAQRLAMLETATTRAMAEPRRPSLHHTARESSTSRRKTPLQERIPQVQSSVSNWELYDVAKPSSLKSRAPITQVQSSCVLISASNTNRTIGHSATCIFDFLHFTSCHGT